MITKIGMLLSAFAVAATLAGCGGEEPHENMPGGTPGGKANEADIAFATQMIPHHEQAIAMAALVPSRAENPKVRALAEQIEQAQDPEIKTMTGWLKQWDAPTPGGDMGGVDHGSGDMPGMMPEEDMAELDKAKGAEFDQMWLTMMIEHHEGAIEMARTELDRGSHAGAKEMAQAIIDGQQAEIEEMRALLKRG